MENVNKVGEFSYLNKNDHVSSIRLSDTTLSITPLINDWQHIPCLDYKQDQYLKSWHFTEGR